MHKKISACAAYLLTAFAPTALATDTTHDYINEALTQQDNSFFTLTVENDLFGAGTDENYTSGVRISYHDGANKPPEFIATIIDALPPLDVNKLTNPYYTFGQNLYTPQDITTITPDPDDRPYAAFLYASVGYISFGTNHIDDLELTLGVVGPTALGKQTQRYVHRVIDSDDPRGWSSQLRNEPGLILAWQRTWSEAGSVNLDPFYLRVAPHVGLTLGNIYTYANTGFTFQLGPADQQWQTTPTRVRPAIPGAGLFTTQAGELSWSIFAGVEGRAVARNLFLDGNTFANSYSVDKKHGVLDISGGLTISYSKIQMAYTINWRSKEFNTQKRESVFGSVSLGYRF